MVIDNGYHYNLYIRGDDSMNDKCLTCLKANESCKVKEISGCCKAKKRLYELGLHKGVSIKVMKNDVGPIILCLAGHKLALGRGIARNIIIEH